MKNFNLEVTFTEVFEIEANTLKEARRLARREFIHRLADPNSGAGSFYHSKWIKGISKVKAVPFDRLKQRGF